MLISLLAVLALCILVRCLHLLNSDHYYILGPDSYFFHWVSKLYLSGETSNYFIEGHQVPTIWHTGLSYPLAWISIALAWVFRLTRAEALTWTCKFLPPLLGVVTTLLIYWIASRMYSRTVGIFAAFSSAVFGLAAFITVAGYVDRDALSLLLITVGVLLFYLSKDWQWKIGKLNIGWMLAALLVVGIEVVLFLEWVWVGPALLLTILITYVVFEFFAILYQHTQVSLKENEELSTWAASARNIVPSLQRTDWRPLTLIIGLSALALIPDPGMVKQAISGARAIFATEGVSYTSEMRGLTIGNVIGYFNFLIIPLVLGLWVAARRRRRVDILCLSWFVALFFVSWFAGRVIIYTAPAVCLLCGLGLAFLWEFKHSPAFLRLIRWARVTLPPELGLVRIWDFIDSPAFMAFMRRLVRVGTVLLLLLLILLTSLQAYFVGSDPRAAPHSNWYDALIWLRDENNTPSNAVVMTWWDYGYWILDIAERTPVVDNGYRPEYCVSDIGRAYCTNQDSEAIEVMEKYGASYLIFSKEAIATLPGISDSGLGQAYGDGKSIPPELRDSLFARALSEDFRSDEPLVVAYRNDEVVILSLQ